MYGLARAGDAPGCRFCDAASLTWCGLRLLQTLVPPCHAQNNEASAKRLAVSLPSPFAFITRSVRLGRGDLVKGRMVCLIP